MSNPLHARYYADRACQQKVSILANVPLAQDTYRLRFACPPIARAIVPGQFVMVRLSDCSDPLIGRALALYDTVPDEAGNPSAIDVVYLVKGKFTQQLRTRQPGQWLDVWGPLGNGFSLQPADHLILAAGGIGQTPFLAVAQERLGKRTYGPATRQAPAAERITFCYGARTAAMLAGVADFERAGVEVRVCTDDGSQGLHGLVTDALAEILPSHGHSPRILCCGPEPMMAAVSELARRHGMPCEVSLETPMACGIGICFSCVARVRDAHGEWDYKRTCVEGPVFDATKIAW